MDRNQLLKALSAGEHDKATIGNVVDLLLSMSAAVREKTAGDVDELLGLISELQDDVAQLKDMVAELSSRVTALESEEQP